MLTRKTAKAGVIAGTVAVVSVLLPDTVTAGGPVFSIGSTAGKAGETVPVKVFLSEGPTQTAACNFTVVFSNSAQLASSNITGQVAPGLGSGFNYLDNSLTTSEGLEYRAVLESSWSSVYFDSSGPIHVATINVPLSSDLQPGEVINIGFRNEFDTDGRTGLVGVSDEEGFSIVPGQEADPAEARPNAEGGTITVAFEFDFRPGDTPLDGWEFVQITPTPPAAGLTGTQQNGSGFVVGQDASNTFGFWQTKDEVGSIIPSAGPGNVLVHHWTFATNAEANNRRQVPTIRLRSTKGDQPFTQLHEYQQPSSQVDMMPTGPDGERSFTAANWVPPARSGGNPDRDAFILAFDIISHNDITGQPGAFIHIRELEVMYLPETALGSDQLVYQHDFSGGDTDGFQPPNEAGIPGAIYPVVASSGNGLGVQPTRGPGDVLNPQGAPEISFGFWEKVLDEWVVEAGKIYRIDYTVASTAPSVDQANTARLRFTVGENDFIGQAVVDAGSEDVTPTAEGRALTAFIKIPDVLAGNSVKLSFDGYQPFQQGAGAVILKDIMVRSYDHP